MTGRPKTLEKSQAVFLLWVELEASDAFLVRPLLFLAFIHYEVALFPVLNS